MIAATERIKVHQGSGGWPTPVDPAAGGSSSLRPSQRSSQRGGGWRRLATAAAASLTSVGTQLDVASSLGIGLEAARPLAGFAAPVHNAATWAALVACNSWCAVLGVLAAGVRLQLFSTIVDSESTPSHGAKVWAVQLVAPAATGGSRGCPFWWWQRDRDVALGPPPSPARHAAGHAQWGSAIGDE